MNKAGKPRDKDNDNRNNIAPSVRSFMARKR